MSRKRTYRPFTHQDAVLSICCDQFDTVTAEIIHQRRLLEDYISRHNDFLNSFEPIELLRDAPVIAQRMAHAAGLVGVGPMAAVAGAMAQCGAEAAIEAGTSEVIVDNGGDVYLTLEEPALIGLGTGTLELNNRLGLELHPDDTPIALCSSSGLMGHSKSLGRCNLATVVASDAALADAAATLAANLVQTAGDVDAALERIAAIEEVDGVVIVKDDRIGFAGKIPPLVKIR